MLSYAKCHTHFSSILPEYHLDAQCTYNPDHVYFPTSATLLQQNMLQNTSGAICKWCPPPHPSQIICACAANLRIRLQQLLFQKLNI